MNRKKKMRKKDVEERKGRKKDIITVKQQTSFFDGSLFLPESAEKVEKKVTRKYYDHCQPDRQLMVHTHNDSVLPSLLGGTLMNVFSCLGVEDIYQNSLVKLTTFFCYFFLFFCRLLRAFIIFSPLVHRILYLEAVSLVSPLNNNSKFLYALSFIYSLMLCVLHLFGSFSLSS